MIKAYFEFAVIPNEVMAKHKKIKLEAKTKRLDCIKYNGTYKGVEPFMNAKGMLFFYLSRASNIVHTTDERRADYVLQNNSMNFSSIYTLSSPDLTGFAWGEPNNKKLRSNGMQNPMYEFKDDGFLFIINPEYTKIELLIVEGGRFTIQAYLKQLAFGEFDELLDEMRMNTNPFFEY